MDNLCPQPACRAVLVHHTDGEFDTWVCPNGHGAGATITELWGHFQDDEIKAIWDAAKKGAPSGLKSPGLGLPMVTVTINADDDETEGNSGPNAHTVTLDVSPDEEFVWFDTGELEQLAGDLPNPEPTASDLDKIKQLSDGFVNTWAAETREASRQGFVGWFRRGDDKLLGS